MLPVITVILLAAVLILLVFLLLKKPQNSGTQVAVLEERCAALESDKSELNERLEKSLKVFKELDEEKTGLVSKVARLESDLSNERKQSEEKLKLLTEAKEELGNQFKVLAGTILEDTSKKFTEHNNSSLDTILKPLKEKLEGFQKDVSEKFTTEGKERHTLANHVKELVELNKQLSEDATNLTKALKGEVKTQGNWGEMILERILEVSGLAKGVQYDVQEYHKSEAGEKLYPDVVIHLPEDRHMVIDSKVSLVAYEQYVSTDDEALKAQALKQHIASVKAHIDGLSSKEYQKLHEDNSPDFVILFMPLEAAFHLAISQGDLWEQAWKKNILLVSPSTLLFVMRIVSQLWNQAKQNENAQEISARGAALYDKLVLFVQEFEKMGGQIDNAQKSYQTAYGRLTSGAGNVIRQAEMLTGLGVKPTKELPKKVVSDAMPAIEGGE